MSNSRFPACGTFERFLYWSNENSWCEMKISSYVNLSSGKGPTKSPSQIKVVPEAKQITLQSTYLILETALDGS